MRESLDTRDTSREADADRAIAGFVFPLDDEDMAKIAQKMEQGWHLDNDLLRAWDKVRNIILLCFRLAGGHRLLKSLVSRETRIDARSLQFFISVGWLSGRDFKIITDLQYWSSMVTANRPSALKSEQIKSIDRDEQPPMREFRSIEGSILTSPPAPAEGQEWLKALINRAGEVIPALRNCEKRLNKRDGVKALAKANDPNRMGDRGKEIKTRIPDTPEFFVDSEGNKYKTPKRFAAVFV